MDATAPTPTETPNNGGGLKRALFLVGSGYLIFLLCDPRDGLAKLSLQYLLKDHLHLTSEQMAAFKAIVFFAWYCKPLAGLLTDSFPIFGSRRRSYLFLSTGTAAVLWLAIGILPKTYETLLWGVLILNIGLVLGQTTLGGLMVEAGKGGNATGRLTSQRIGAENAGSLIAGLAGGWLAAQAFGYTIGTNFLLAFLLFMIVFRLLHESKTEPVDVSPWESRKIQLLTLLKSKTMWIATGFWFLVRFAPGLQTQFFYYQTETLKLTPEFIGFLSFLNAATSIIGCFIYAAICRKMSLRNLLYLGVSLNVLATFLYLIYTSKGTAMVAESCLGLAVGMSWLAILDLLARSAPKGCEALGYALIFALGNLSISISDITGSWLFAHMNQNFMNLVWVNVGTTALILVVVPFLPKMLVEHRDGETPPLVTREEGHPGH